MTPVILLRTFAVLQLRGHTSQERRLLSHVLHTHGAFVMPSIPPDQEDHTIPAFPQAGPRVDRKSKITKRLISLGSTILSDYSDPATDYDPFVPKRHPTHEIVEPKSEEASVVSAVAKLNKAAQRAFGVVGDFLKYDYSEEFGPLRKCFCYMQPSLRLAVSFEGKRCILEITRSDDSKRVYSTRHEFARKSEAKTKAASIAIDHGAIDFITYGDEPRSKGFTLAPVNTPLHAIEDVTTSSDVVSTLPEETRNPHEAGIVEDGSTSPKDPPSVVTEIEKCCQEWRAGRIKPTYYFASDTKSSGMVAFKICRNVH